MAEMTPNEALAVLCGEGHEEDRDGSCVECLGEWPCPHSRAVDVLAAEVGRLSPELIAALAAYVEASTRYRHQRALPRPLRVSGRLQQWGEAVAAAASDFTLAAHNYSQAMVNAINAECARLAEAGSGDGDGSGEG